MPVIDQSRPYLQPVRRALATVATIALILFTVTLPAAFSTPPANAADGQTTTTQTVAVTGKVSTEPGRDWLDWATGFVTIVGGLVAAVTLVVIWLQLKSSDRTTRQQRAAEVASVWNDRKFNELFSPAWAFMSAGDIDECIAKIRAWLQAAHGEEPCLPATAISDEDAAEEPLARKNDVWYVLGFLEDVALRYNENEIPRRWVALTLGPNLISVLSGSLWLVAFLRSDYRWPTLNCELIAAAQDLHRRKWPLPPGSAQNPRALRSEGWWARRRELAHPIFRTLAEEPPTSPVRVLCHPSHSTSTSSEDWERARQLSHLLATDDRLEAFKARQPRLPAIPKRWRVVVVPGSIMAGPDDIHRDEKLAEVLNARLGPLTGPEVDQLIEELGSIQIDAD